MALVTGPRLGCTLSLRWVQGNLDPVPWAPRRPLRKSALGVASSLPGQQSAEAGPPSTWAPTWLLR